jgi:6-phosphogluconolactonase
MRTLLCLLVFALLPSAVLSQTPEKFRVYLGTYTGKLSKGIYTLELDLKDGSMSKPIVAAETNSPSFVAIAPNQKFLYAVSEGGGKGTINAFAIDAKTGGLTLLNSQSSGGSGPCHLVVDATGSAVLAANYGSGSCCSIPIGKDGKLLEGGSVHQHQGKSKLPNQQGPHGHSINLDKANKFAFCADLGLDKILVYKFDASKGALAANDPPAFDLQPGTGPRHFAFHPNGKWAYINGEMSLSIVACEYDADKGMLTKKQELSTIPKEVKKKGGSTAEVVVHPSGKFVYVSNRDPYNSIAIFSIDQKTGALKAVGHEDRKISTPRNFAIEPTGKYMLVANQSGNTVISFGINQTTGELIPTGSEVSVGAPVCVRFMPLAK